MARQPQSRFWRNLRRTFRWCRISVLLLVLTLLLAAVWLNRVGLPNFLKERLVVELRQRGVDLQFSRMRLHWYRGLVAENVRLGRHAETNAPQLSATEAELLVDGHALLRRDLQLSGVALRGGRMTLPVWGTNASPRELLVEKISGELRFSTNDAWELVGFHASSFGVSLMLGGSVTNASELRKLKLTSTVQPKEKTAAAFWYDFITSLEASTFDAPAEIIGRVDGDAKVPSSFHATINVSSPRIVSPWGRGTNVSVSAQLAPSKGGTFQADIKVQARDAFTKWGRAGSLNLQARVVPSFTRWTPTNAHLSINLRQGRTPWGKAGSLTLVADFVPNPSDDTKSLAHYTMHAQQTETKWGKATRLDLTSDAVLTSSNLWPSTATARLQFNGGEIQWGRAAGGTVEGSLTLPALEAMEFADTNVTWLTRLDRVGAELQVRLDGVRSPHIELTRTAFGANWRAPALVLRDFHANLYGGEVDGRASLDTQTRKLTVSARTTVDPHKVQSFLDTNSQKWLAQFTWEQAPLLNASAEMVLPVWTNGTRAFAETDWDKTVMPTLRISGDFEAGRSTYQAVPVTSAKSSFTFSNFAWRLPDLVVTRPEGRAVIAHAGHSRTHEFSFDIDSTINPSAIVPLVGPNEREFLNLLVFTNAPRLRLQMAGWWHAPEKTSFYAEVAATNLTFRDLPVMEARSTITLTNKVLVFAQPIVVRSEGTGRADQVRVDMNQALVFIDNATGSLDPWSVTHAVGPEPEEVMRPYHFLKAPLGHVYGVVGIDDIRRSDLHFEVSGGPFDWTWFHFQQITGHVHWLGNSVTLSNVSGSIDGGHLEGSARFDFPPKRGCDFSFRTLVNEINLHSLITDLGNKTNRVEGILRGSLVVAGANTDNMKSWQGYGNVAINDGYLWDFPALGLFTPIVNAVVPGAGNSKAKEAAGIFVMTNSVIYSSDLTVHASGGMRLKYQGTVDFDTRINGSMAARLFRDTPLVGGLMSTALWGFTKVFEYRVAGTLARPVAYPKLLHPFRSTREPESGDEK